MEKEKLKKKRNKKSKKPNFLTYYCGCLFQSSDSDDQNNNINVNVKKNSSEVSEEPKISITYQPASSSLHLVNKTSSENVHFSKNDLPRIDHVSSQQQNSSESDVEERDKLVRTILNKYLEFKKMDSDEKIVQNKQKTLSENEAAKENPQDLNVEYFSSDSSDIVYFENSNSPSTDFDSSSRRFFLTKSKSAPVHSETSDSFAEISIKMNKNQIPTPSKSHVTCSCGSSTCKKKLALIFTKSSDEMLSHEDNSLISLQYKINCEGIPVMMGTLKTENVLPLQHKDKYLNEHKERDGKYIAQELYLDPLVGDRNAEGDQNNNTASLKWKLIISHHERGCK